MLQMRKPRPGAKPGVAGVHSLELHCWVQFPAPPSSQFHSHCVPQFPCHIAPGGKNGEREVR